MAEALNTDFCELLGIEHPVVQASLGPWSRAELAAAVSKAGGLGSIGTATMSADAVRAQVERVRELTSKPFAINHTARPFVEEVFAAMLDAEPRAISYAIGHPGELPKRVHDAGALFIQQVHTVDQAEAAAASGADVLIAQGGEAGGFGGTVGAMALVPQVVDAVDPVPVLAAGGIADGRGLAAALMLGAQGVNIGTRFLATEEARIAPEWTEAILEARSEDPHKVDFAQEIFPPTGPGGYDIVPRTLPTAFTTRWLGRRAEASKNAAQLREELDEAIREQRIHELVPFTGQTAGMIDDVLPAAELVRRLVDEAERALRGARPAKS